MAGLLRWYRRSVSAQLLVQILFFSVVVTVVVWGVQLYFEYQRAKRDLAGQLADIRDSRVASLTAAVWVANDSLIESLLHDILHHADIVSAEIRDGDRVLLAVRKAGRTAQTYEVFPLAHAYRGEPRVLGELRVGIDTAATAVRLRQTALWLLGTQAARTFLIAVIVFLLVRQVVTRHLDRVASYLRHLDPSVPQKPLRLDRTAAAGPGDRDELEQVVHAVNDMADSLRAAYGQLGVQLRQREARFEAFMENFPGAAFIQEVDGRVVYANAAWFRILQRSPSRHIGQPLHEILPPEQAEHFVRQNREVCRDGRPREYEDSLTPPGGRTHWYITRKFLLPREEGAPLVGGVAIEVTERREAQESLRRSEERLSLAQRLAGIGTWDWWLDSDRMFWSAELYAIAGVDPGTFVPGFAATVQLLHPEDRSRFREAVDACRERGEEMDVEVRLRRDGTSIWVAVIGNRTQTGAAGARLTGICMDITERKRMEDQQTRFFSLSSGLLMITDFDHVIRRVNPAWQRVLGWTPEELIGKSAFEFVHPEDLAATRSEAATTSTGGMIQALVNRWRDRDGEYHTLAWSAVPSREEGLNYAQATDITRQERLESRLRQVEKMDAIGQLAGGIAHDFNNQLAGILGYASLLERRLDDPQLHEFAAKIIQASRRAGSLTDQLLSFARRGKYLSVPVDLHGLVGEVMDLLRHSIDKRIVLRQELTPMACETRGDPTQLQNVLLNLALNARDAMPEGGDLTFRTWIEAVTPSTAIEDAFHLEPGDYAVVAVRDTGCGMTADVRAHAFEPFFTTKPKGQGTGMGLAAVYGAVNAHHGAVAVTSTPDQGTTVAVYLPALRGDRGDQPADTVWESASRAGDVRVLLVDDEELARNVAREILEEVGAVVTVCADGREALDWYGEHWREVDVVVLDLVMPRLSGRETFAGMQQVNPEVRVVLASGYSLDGEAQAIMDAGARVFVHKPFLPAELSEAVATAARD